MHALYELSVFMHILAAMIWIGGMLFLVLVLVPVMRREEYRGAAAGLVHWAGVRFRWVGWLCLGLLVLSGIGNLLSRELTWATLSSADFWQGPFGRALGIKLVLVAIILASSALHDFVIGPRATAAWQADPAAPATRRLRRQAGYMGRLNLVLALVIVGLGVILVRGWP